MLFFFCVPLFFTYLLFGVWLHNRVPLEPEIRGIILLYDVLYTWHILIRSAADAAAALCVAILLLLLQQLLLFVIMCRMANNVAGSLNLIRSSAISLSSFKHDEYLTYAPLGSTVALTASIAYSCAELRRASGLPIHARS